MSATPRRWLRRIVTLPFALMLVLPLVASPLPASAAVVYRINAGGPAISGTPSWQADTRTSPAPFVNTAEAGSTTYSTSNAIDMTHASVPAGTPEAMFKTERWDGPAQPEMQWDFPVTAGVYEVRLHFAEIYPQAFAVGARVFNVSIEGSVVLNNYDVFADVGGYKAVTKSFIVSSDSNLDIDFGHVTENPTIKGIEIINAATSPNQLGATPSSLPFGEVVVDQTKTLGVQLTNMGGAGSPNITVQQTTIGGSNPAQFSDSFVDGSNIVLQPGQSTSFNVSFKPTSTGTKSASLSIAHSGSNSPLSIPLSGTGVSTPPPSTTIGFGKTTLSGETSSAITALDFGPDGKLYVGQFNGVVKVYTVTRNGPNSYAVSNTQTLTSIQSTPNHNDNGQLNTSVNTRLITGLLAVGTASNPVVYVTHSDPRIGGGSSGTDTNLDTNSSMISRLTWTGSTWNKLDLVRGLPRSEENHAANGMALAPATNTLYVAMGGNTNKGAPSNNFAYLPEFALSAAILKVNLSAIGNSTYDLPTLNDEDRSGNPDANDPFGGNNGKNQAILLSNGPVGVHAPGFRNPYDVVITESGKMYTIDNGGNSGWGQYPINEGPQGTCTNQPNEPGNTDPDALHHVTAGYYGGHPNPTRANTNNKFNSSNPQSPVSSGNAIECDYRKAGSAESTALTTFPGSTNGLTEYTTNNFGGQMKGDLLTAGYNKNEIYRIKLNSAGTSVTLNESLFSTVGSKPLPITAHGSSDPFPGTVWVGDQGNGNIYVFEPNDFGGSSTPTCTGAYSWTLDEDGDGYKNADEIDNGTNPCSAADVPPDWDGDFLSNLNDPDDDNDGIPDTSDPFAIDPHNGKNTKIPVSYTWDNDAPNPGGLMSLGFTGLMTNGITDYEALFDPDGMTAGGAAGVMTVDAVSAGDALGTANTQQNGFQFGVDAHPNQTGPFTAHTAILGPFSGISPQNEQSMGLFIGTGNQDNYVKIVTHANGGAGGVRTLKEVNGSVSNQTTVAESMPGPERVDLYLDVDPAVGTIQPSYTVTKNGTVSARKNVGGVITVPTSWFTGSMGLAVGVISTSAGPGAPFPATWGLIEVTGTSAPPPSGTVAQDSFQRSVSSGWGSATTGGAWSVVSGSTGNFAVNGSKGTIATPKGTGNGQLAALGSTSVRDVDAQIQVTFPQKPTSARHFGYLVLRRQSGGAHYRVAVYVTSKNAIGIRGQTNATNLFSDVGTGLSFAPGDTYNLRVQADGASPTTIRAKVWKLGQAEPSTWNVTTTDATSALQTAGSVGVMSLNTSSASSTSILFDELVASGAGGTTPPPPPPPPSEGLWQTKAASGPNRQEVSYVEVGGKFYLGWGNNQQHEVFDPATNSWTRLANMPATLDHIQGIALNGKIYYIGGLAGWPSPHVGTLYIYDPATDTFTQGASMSRGRGAGGLAVYQGKIYYAGGLADGTAVNWFDVYDPATNAWTQLPNMPRTRDHFQGAVVGNRFYAIAGRQTQINNMITHVDAFDFTTNRWVQDLWPLPTPRGGFATAVVGGEIFVIGGEGGNKTYTEVEAYDPSSDRWRSLAPMPTARHGIQGAVCNGGVYIAAGGKTQGGGSPTNVHEVFFPGGTATTCSGSGGGGGGGGGGGTTTVAQDSFQRTVSNGWGSATTGGAWSVVSGAAGNFAVNGSKGTIATPSGAGNTHLALLGSTSERDVDARALVTFSQTPVSARHFGCLVLRHQSVGDHYRVCTYVTKAGVVGIRGQSGGGSSLFSDVTSGLSFSPGDTFVLRVQAQGASPTTIRAKVWKQGQSEPSGWNVTATNSITALQNVGSVGVASQNTSSAAATLLFDELLATKL